MSGTDSRHISTIGNGGPTVPTIAILSGCAAKDPAQVSVKPTAQYTTCINLQYQRHKNLGHIAFVLVYYQPYPWRTWAHVATRRKVSTLWERGAAPDKMSRKFPPKPSFTLNVQLKRVVNTWDHIQVDMKNNIRTKSWQQLLLHHLVENNFVKNWSCFCMFIAFMHVTQFAATSKYSIINVWKKYFQGVKTFYYVYNCPYKQILNMFCILYATRR